MSETVVQKIRIDEAASRDRPATRRETAGDTGTADAGPDRGHADEPVPASEPDRND